MIFYVFFMFSDCYKFLMLYKLCTFHSSALVITTTGFSLDDIITSIQATQSTSAVNGKIATYPNTQHVTIIIHVCVLMVSMPNVQCAW